jgi:hypothetical protein
LRLRKTLTDIRNWWYSRVCKGIQVLRLFLKLVYKELIYAEVETHVAGTLVAGGLSGYPKSLFDEINVVKP